MTDEQLMIKVREGDLDAAASLYNRYSGPVYNYFLRICFNKEISRDLTQNVFFRIIKYRRSFNPEHRFRSWIYQIARNTYSDHMKKRGARQSNFCDLEEMNLSVGSKMDDIEQVERVQNLQKALTRIPREHREILVMKNYQQLKNREIADIMGCSENTVKGKVHRAVASLRKAFFIIERN